MASHIIKALVEFLPLMNSSPVTNCIETKRVLLKSYNLHLSRNQNIKAMKCGRYVIYMLQQFFKKGSSHRKCHLIVC